MKLPFPFFSSKKEESEYYLALILTDEKVGAVILKAVDGSLKKINAQEVPFTESLEDQTVDDLISAVDKAISRAEEVLPPDIQTHQTVFGVKDTWVDNETKKIKKEYLEQLKKVCNALDLTPIGFMVTAEAITHLMQDEEGAPVSAAFAEVGKKYVTLSLLRGGKVIESVTSPHLESTPATVDKLLGHFTVPVLPARIVIFQSKPNERTSHAFMNHTWSKQLPFLHVPQVTVLPESFDMRSVMYGAATQMGFKVIEDEYVALQHIKPAMAEAEKEYEKESQVESDNLAPVDENAPLDFGKDTEETGQGEEKEAASADDFGFVVDQDIAERKPSETQADEHELPVHHRAMHEESMGEEEIEEENDRTSKQNALLAGLSGFKLPKNLSKLPVVASVVGLFKGNQSKTKIIIPIVVGIILIIGIILFYFYKMQANVILTMKPNMVSQDETVTFSTAEPNDFNNNLVAAKSVSTSINSQVSTNATGKKDVGDKAKGTVTIFNNDSDSVTLNSGTTLKASNGQVFTLDNDVKVASATGDIFSGTKPGTANASVTAQDIGTDGNVPSNTTFVIGSGNTVAAKNDNAFSGGTKKSVTVVSANDITKLRSQVASSVQDSAKQKLAGEASSGETVLPLLSDPVLANQQFNHHVGDQANQVTLTASVVYTGFSYTNSDLDNYAKSVMKQKYPQDPNVANKSVKETISDAKQHNKVTATATVSIDAGLLPNIDTQDVISNIKDKSLGEAKTSLGNLPQVEKADITFSPPIPLLPLFFPKLPHHISVTITTQ